MEERQKSNKHTFWAAIFDANVSGRLVPNATKVVAVTASFKPIMQPSMLARSPESIAFKSIFFSKIHHCTNITTEEDCFQPLNIRKWRKQNWPMMAVMKPIKTSAQKKANHPPRIVVGGIRAAIIFHGNDKMCNTQSSNVAFSISPALILVAWMSWKVEMVV